MRVATKKRVRLVLSINSEGIGYAYFRVRYIHRTYLAARRRAVTLRKRGFLARVVPFSGYYLVATRRPRKYMPATWMLEV